MIMHMVISPFHEVTKIANFCSLHYSTKIITTPYDKLLQESAYVWFRDILTGICVKTWKVSV